jgi:hypothetical protein
MIVLDISGVHLHGKQRAVGVGDDMTFASLHLLARIKAAWTATFLGFHALAVDRPCGGSSLASRRQASALDQGTIDPPPNQTVAPTVEIVLDGRERRKVFRQGASQECTE